MRKLTDEHLALLTELARLGDNGALTGRLACIACGLAAPAAWATRRMHTLSARGLVRRHDSNAERWFITPAGRSALNPETSHVE